MSLWDELFGKTHKEQFRQVPNISPEQQQLLNQLLGGLGQNLGYGQEYLGQMLQGGPEATQAFSAPYMRQFREQILPEIGERYAGVGGLSSSGFQQELGQAGAGLSERLASLREDLRGQAMDRLQNLLQTGLGTQATQGYYTPSYRSSGMFQGILSGGAQGMGMGLGSGLGSIINRFITRG